MLDWLQRETVIRALKKENRQLKDLLRRCALNHWLTDEMNDAVNAKINDYLMHASMTDFYGRKYQVLVRMSDEPVSPKAPVK